MGRKGSKRRGRKQLTVQEEPAAAAPAPAPAAAAAPAAASGARGADGQPAPKKKKREGAEGRAAREAAAAAAAPFFESAAPFAVAPVGAPAPGSLDKVRKPLKVALGADGPAAPTAEQVLAYLGSGAARDTTVLARQLLAWLLHPLPVAKFRSKCWQRRVLLLLRGGAAAPHYGGLLRLDELRGLVAASPLQYGTDLDITQYSAETGRKTLHSSGLASEDTVWNSLESGYSLRFSRPHVHHRGLWALLAQLEEHFGCGVAVNAYVTPAAADAGASLNIRRRSFRTEC